MTPGPWIDQDGTTTGREVIAPNAPKSKRVVARFGGPDREANARAVAALPSLLRQRDELLAVLKELVASSDAYEGEQSDDERCHRAFDDARRLINDAEGRADV